MWRLGGQGGDDAPLAPSMPSKWASFKVSGKGGGDFIGGELQTTLDLLPIIFKASSRLVVCCNTKLFVYLKHCIDENIFDRHYIMQGRAWEREWKSAARRVAAHKASPKLCDPCGTQR